MRLLKSIILIHYILIHFPLLGNEESAFYAICSLHHYVSTWVSPEDDTAIHFSQEDVAKLWDKAFSVENVCPELLQAYQSYEKAACCYESDEGTFVAGCNTTQKSLEAVWKRMLPQPESDFFQAGIFAKSVKGQTSPNFDANPFLDSVMQGRMRPHLLPSKHAAVKFLETIFKQGNPIQNIYAFNNAGFKKIAQHSSQCMVASHPRLGKYLLKLYFFDVESQKLQIPSWEAFCTRCESAAGVRTLIKKHKMRYFSVSDKWLYVLPSKVLSESLPGEYKHPVLLVVEDMDLVGQRKSAEAWLTKTTRRHLDELYYILSHGYGSTKLPQNVPYTKKHKFAFIDTEYPRRLFDYAKVKRFISAEMQAYWDELVRKGGDSSVLKDPL